MQAGRMHLPYRDGPPSYVRHAVTSVSAIPKVWSNTRIPSHQPFFSPPVKMHRVAQNHRSMMEMYGSIPPRFQPGNAANRNDYEEGFPEAFDVEDSRTEDRHDRFGNESTSSLRREPISLHMWIIKPVPDSPDICVEGKKSLLEENFWHSDVVTERLDEKTVMTATGSVYRLEGNMELLDAIAAGFSRSLVEAFWLGFPPDWKSLITTHFQLKSQPVDRVEVPQSDHDEADNDVSFVDEVDLDDTVTDMSDRASSRDTHTDPRDGVGGADMGPQSAEEDDDIIVSEAVVDSQEENEVELEQKRAEEKQAKKSTKKHNDKEESSKSHVLNKWIVKFLPNGKGIYVVGEKSNGSLWHSSAIEKRLNARKVLSCTGSVYKLNGSMDKLLALSENLPTDIITKFRKGFPKEWQEIVQEHIDEIVIQPTEGNQKATANKHSTPAKVNKNVRQNRNKETKKKSNDVSRIRGKSITELVNEDLKARSAKKKGSKTVQGRGRPRKTIDPEEEDITTPSSSKKEGKSGRGRGRLKKDQTVDITNKKANKTKHKTSRLESEVATDSDTDVKTGKSLSARKYSSKAVQSKSQSVPGDDKHYESSTFVITPRGQLLDLSTLGRSRSGRLIKPPLHVRQSYHVEGDTVVVKADTAGGALSLKQFEGQFQNITRKIQPYFNPRRKDVDYSILNRSKRSSVSSKSDAAASSNDSLSKENSSVEDADISAIRLDKQVESVLENNKAKRRQSNKKRVTCYTQQVNDSTDQTNNSRNREAYDLDETCESLDRTLVNETSRLDESSDKHEAVIGPRTSRGSTRKTVSATQKRGTNKRTTVVPSGVGRRTRSSDVVEIPDSEQEEDKVDKGKQEKEKQEKAGKKAAKSSRQTRTRKLSEAKPGTEVQKTVQADDDNWTKEEKDCLYRACKTVPVDRPDYWEQVAVLVGTRSADSCSAMFYTAEQAPASTRKNKNPTKEKPRATCITATAGTLKRKQQLTDILISHNENYEDDLFNSTPFRQNKKKKRVVEDLGDDLFEELARRQGHSRFETPKGDHLGHGNDVTFATPDKTPATHLNVEATDTSFQADGYVHKVAKRQQQARRRSSRRKASVDTPQPTKSKKSLSPPSMKLFHHLLNESNQDKENCADSEQEEDYYWEDQQAEEVPQ